MQRLLRTNLYWQQVVPQYCLRLRIHTWRERQILWMKTIKEYWCFKRSNSKDQQQSWKVCTHQVKTVPSVAITKNKALKSQLFPTWTTVTSILINLSVMILIHPTPLWGFKAIEAEIVLIVIGLLTINPRSKLITQFQLTSNQKQLKTTNCKFKGNSPNL